MRRAILASGVVLPLPNDEEVTLGRKQCQPGRDVAYTAELASKLVLVSRAQATVVAASNGTVTVTCKSAVNMTGVRLHGGEDWQWLADGAQWRAHDGAGFEIALSRPNFVVVVEPGTEPVAEPPPRHRWPAPAPPAAPPPAVADESGAPPSSKRPLESASSSTAAASGKRPCAAASGGTSAAGAAADDESDDDDKNRDFDGGVETSSPSEYEDDEDDGDGSDGGGFLDDAASAAAETSQRDTVVEPRALVDEQEAHVTSLAETFALSRPTVHLLLSKAGWRVDSLRERLAEDRARVLESVGIREEEDALAAGAEGAAAASAVAGGDDGAAFTCSVCFCECEAHEASAARCGHAFCNDCWAGYLTSEIGSGASRLIGCMAPKCTAPLDFHLIRALADPASLAKYARFAADAFVEDCPWLRWCPAEHCGRIIKLGRLGKAEAHCACGHVFCPRCARDSHFPMTCEQVVRWEEKNQDEGETVKWLKAHAQQCPKCRQPVEKNGGCNWVQCRCGTGFCFFCGSTDPSHHDARFQNSCNKPPTATADASTKDDLALYGFYFGRYQAHATSLRKELELRETIARRARGMLEGAVVEAVELDGGGGGGGESGVADVERAREIVVEAARAAAAGLHGVGDGRVVWLFEAVETLLACRRTLKNTYAFAYFLPHGFERDLFDELQGGLDRAVEALSGALEEQSREPPSRDDVARKAEGARLRLRRLRERADEGFGLPAPSAAAGGGGGASSSGGRVGGGGRGDEGDPIVLDDD